MHAPTDAEAALCSTNGRENFHRLIRLLMCGGVRLLKETFDYFHSPTDLPLRLADPAIVNQLKGARLSKPEWDCLYPSPGMFGESTDFDITLTFRLLRAICNLTEPLTGWNNLPNSTDHSLEADLVRIKWYRNSVYGHNRTMEMTNSEFLNLWNEISKALLRIAGSISNEKRDEWKKAIDDLLNGPLTTEVQGYVDELQLWYKKDLDVKDAVEQLGDQLKEVDSDFRDQLQHFSADVRDQLLQGNAQVGDKLQQIDQKLDYVTNVLVEQFLKGGQPISRSPLPVVPTSQAAAASESMVTVPTNQEKPLPGGADGISRRHLQGDGQDISTQLSIGKVNLPPNEVSSKSMSMKEEIEDIGNMTPKGLEALDEMKQGMKNTLKQPEEKSSWTAKEVSSRNMSTEKEIDDIDDIEDMIQTMTPLGVSPKGLEALDEMKQRLKDTLKLQEEKSSWTAKEVSSRNMSTEKEIDDIDDIEDMIQTMTPLGVSPKGLEALDEMKQGLKDTLKLQEEKSSWTAKEAFSVLTDAKEEDEKDRDTLYKFFEDTESCLNSMDDNLRFLLEQNIVNYKDKITWHKRNLEKKEYIVLVAGETSSGKSTLLNLILGEQILPYSLVSTTPTICELKYGTTPKLVAHYKDKNPETGHSTRTVKLGQSEGTSQQSYLDEISTFVQSKTASEKGSNYKKIELFWPHSLLKQGIVLVDSPGVGESVIIDDMIKEYLPEAFAFIYVINSVNVGGIQRERLEKLIEHARKVSLDQQRETSPALFVCNKWDQVPPREADEVKNYIIKRLTHYCLSLDPHSQIIFMSSTNATKAQGLGIITEEFTDLTNGIKSVVLKGIKGRLETQWRFLDYLISRMAYHSKVFLQLSHKDREKVNERMMLITARLLKIENQQSSVSKDLQDYLENRTNDAVYALSKYLTSADVVEKFTSWTLDDVPNTEEGWDITRSFIKKAISKRLQDVIESWEEENHVFSDARISVIQYFQQRFNFVEGQLRNLESSVVAEDPLRPTVWPSWPPSYPLAPDNFSVARRDIGGITSPLWAPIGLAVLMLSVPAVAGIMAAKEKWVDWRETREYKKDKIGFVAKASKEYLTEASEEQNLRSCVVEQLTECQVLLRQVVARIPELIEAEKMVFQQLEDDSRSQKDIEDFYRPLYDWSLQLRERMAMFFITEVRAMDISCNDLEWKDDKSSLLGAAAFASVYRGKLKLHEEEQPVALKVWKEQLNESNASAFLAETDLLRKLDYPFIVKFFGSSLLKKGDQARAIIVMEPCKDNLMRHIFQNPENIPARMPSSIPTDRKAIQWARDIANGLQFIHKHGYVHRDLKLENILISLQDVVKIANIGEMSGTPAFTAPEVIRSSVYDSKTDMYSFGVMMWEMWYGRRAFMDVVGDLSTFLDKVVEGVRPSHIEGSRMPLDQWQNLMQCCWDGEAEKRPAAAMCENELTKLYDIVSILDEQLNVHD